MRYLRIDSSGNVEIGTAGPSYGLDLQKSAGAMLETIIETIRSTTLRGAPKIARCAVCGVSCEGWFKVELLYALAEVFSKSSGIQVIPESDHIDLAVSTAFSGFLYSKGDISAAATAEERSGPLHHCRGSNSLYTNCENAVAKESES